MIVYADYITERLQYVANFLSQYWYGCNATVTNDLLFFAQTNLPKFNYSYFDINDTCVIIYPQGILLERDIRQQEITCFEKNSTIYFFQNDSELGFDVFAAVFYLISRYEEYLPSTKDKHGRYDFKNSIAYNNGFLNLPIVDIWLREIAKVLNATFPDYPTIPHQFVFQPTYDIDMARQYQGKGLKRNIGSAVKDVLNGNVKFLVERCTVLTKKSNDPFDSFSWLDDLHQQYQIQPKYFFLVADKNSENDKHILPDTVLMEQLIIEHAKKYEIGLHPSWQSNSELSVLQKEQENLEKISGKKNTSSRQHFLKMSLPQTYQNLLSIGITADYTMGYGGAYGFRASTCTPFYWFDLSQNKSTLLTIFPFCFMDATAIYYLKETPDVALENLKQLYQTVKLVDGYFSMIWHNHILGTSTDFMPWRNMYEEALKTILVK